MQSNPSIEHPDVEGLLRTLKRPARVTTPPTSVLWEELPEGQLLPVVEGFTLARDPLIDVWEATSASGQYKIRGRDQAELDAARRGLVRQVTEDWHRALANVATEFQAVFTEVYPPERKH